MSAIAIVHDSVQPYRRPLFNSLNSQHDVTFFLGNQQEVPQNYQTQDWNTSSILSGLRDETFDVVIAPEYTQPAAWKAYIGAWLGKTPVIQWSEIWNTPAWTRRKRIVARGLLRFTDIFIDNYVVPGTPHAQFVSGNTTLNIDEIHIAPNTTHLPASETGATDDHEYPPTVLYFGQVIPRKGVDILVEAVGDIEQEVELLICGGGNDEYRDFLRQRADNLDVPLTMQGWIPEEDVANIYRKSDIYTILSRGDPFAISVVEAMQAETPVIVSEAVGCAQDLVHGKGTGYVVPMNSPQSTATALEKLLDSQRQEKMAKQAQQVATTIPTTERMVEAFNDAISSAISN